jgi:hypothetical protein
MVIKTKLTQADFIKTNFALLYKKPRTWVNIAITIGLAIYYATIAGEDSLYVYVIAIPFFILVVLPPLATWFISKKNYTSNQRITETIEYQFDKDNLVVKGESFQSQLSWDKIYKVTQTKLCILIWQSRASANFIPKRDIWEGDIIELKEILENHKVKNTL